jgi:hypothetical protein
MQQQRWQQDLCDPDCKGIWGAGCPFARSVPSGKIIETQSALAARRGVLEVAKQA